MGIALVCNHRTVGNIAMGAQHIVLALTALVQAELDGMPSGFSPVEADEIHIDGDTFQKFVDEFFRRAEHDGKFRYFVRWAEEMAGIYENITGRSPTRKMSSVRCFEPIVYDMY